MNRLQSSAAARSFLRSPVIAIELARHAISTPWYVEHRPDLARVGEEDVGRRQDRLVEEPADLDAVVAVLLGARGDRLEVPLGAS